ncbi:hypothetical protein YA0089_27085 [Pseudomonas viridiflava]|uniref:hypothetical protein n=1 Tax=Pseudomonas viridiflava TaxID=33069 RepID=UPI0018E630B0|nr:hypothetical protein [Pseudomonas viridiflava]MBI6727283.1 hypothetical protein [Pseudomonas viridiflava]
MLLNSITETEFFDPALIADTPKRPQNYRKGRALAYASHGVPITQAEGHSWHTSSMVAIPYDGVQYCIDDSDVLMMTGNPDKMLKLLNQRALTIERHHITVKEIFHYCEGLEVGPIWALCAGQTQCQVFFGCRDGYLGVLCLNEWSHTLVINYRRNNKYFPDSFNVENVRLRRYK